MKIVALTGGVGGAKLALGLYQLMQQGEQISELTIIVNTADDFVHLGLHISPDLDTLMYTLSGRANAKQGWGLADESWQVHQALAAVNAPTWFQLGDKDLATHLARTHALQQGQSLREGTAALFHQFGVEGLTVLPMCDQPVSTYVTLASTADTTEAVSVKDASANSNYDSAKSEKLSFQHYFVAQQCQPIINGYGFDGIEQASVSEATAAAIQQADAVLICPSNPFVSIAPILAVPGMSEALQAHRAKLKPVLAVSPIVNGAAVKGPTAKMMAELSLAVNNQSIATFYQSLISHLVIDVSDQADAAALASAQHQLQLEILPTLMRSDADKQQLAKAIITLLQGFLSAQQASPAKRQ